VVRSPERMASRQGGGRGASSKVNWMAQVERGGSALDTWEQEGTSIHLIRDPKSLLGTIELWGSSMGGGGKREDQRGISVALPCGRQDETGVGAGRVFSGGGGGGEGEELGAKKR